MADTNWTEEDQIAALMMEQRHHRARYISEVPRKAPPQPTKRPVPTAALAKSHEPVSTQMSTRPVIPHIAF